MKQFWKKHGTFIVIMAMIFFGFGTVISYMAAKGNTPEDRQLSGFGGVNAQAAITDVIELLQEHPDNVLRVYRHIAKGASFAERIAVEAKDKSVWTITTAADDQAVVKAVNDANEKYKNAGKAQITLKNETLQGEDGVVDSHAVVAGRQQGWGPTLVGIGIPLLLAFFIYRLFSRGMGGGNSPFGHKKSPARIFSELPGEKVTLADVQGIDEIKDELVEWIEDIKAWNKEKKAGSATLGGKPDKAKLFKGKPGTGKTLAARAIAAECGIPALIMTGSDFVRIFVGAGSQNWDKAIAEARVERDKNEYKSVFFIIDEVDALTKARGQSMQNNDEGERTLTSVLATIDGIKEDIEGFYFIGMTNQPDKMDPAALRPGRFHPPIEIPVPDEHGRLEILKLYAGKPENPLADDVNLERIARELPAGTTGADIKELFSRAAKIARRDARKQGEVAKTITLAAVLKSVDFQRFGAPISEARSKRVPEKTKDVIFKHEFGHLINGLVLHEISKAFGITWGHEVKVISGMGPVGTGGYVMTGVGENMSLLSETELRAHMVLGFGGTTAEILFNRVRTVGNQNDIMQINRAADEMVTKFHMSPSDEVPAVYVPRRGGSQYLGGEDMPHYDGLGPRSMEQIDEAKGILIRDAEAKARAILQHYKEFFHNWALLREKPGYRMYTDEIYELWNDKTAHIAKPEWLSDYELWSAYWDARSKTPPTRSDLRELKEIQSKKTYKPLVGLGHALKA